MELTLFLRPPSSRLLPNPSTVSPEPPAEAPAIANRGIVVSSQGRSLTEKAALRWLNKLHGISKWTTSPRHSAFLITHHQTGSCDAVFSQLSDTKQSTLSKAAQNLAKLGRKCPKNQGGHLLQEPGNLQSYRPSGNQLTSKSRKCKTTFRRSPLHAHGRGKGFNRIWASRADEDDGDEGLREKSTDENATGRIPQLSSGWLPYTFGTVTMASAAAAVKGIHSSSTHASVEHGGGNGQQPPPGSGDGGGSDNSGDFDAGSNSWSFFGDLIYGPKRIQDEEKLPRSVSIRKRVPGRPVGASERTQNSGRRVNFLASLSSAAGDFMDGEAPIGEERISRGLEEIDDMPNHSKSLGSYSSAKIPFDGVIESPRDSVVHKYNLADPFFGGDGNRLAPDRPDSSSPAGTENVSEDNLKRDASPPMGRSSSFDSTMHSPNGKPQHPPKTYAQGNEVSKVTRGADNYNPHFTSRDLHEVPPEFSSIRGKITEIPGYVQDGGGKLMDHQHESEHATGLSGWVGGLVHSIVGKRTGEPDSGTRDKPVDDDERRKVLVTEVAARTLQIITDQPNEAGLAKSSETGALRRLQRETFSDLLKVRERLDKLEHHSGLRHGKETGDGLAGVKTTLKGEVNSGGAFVLFEDLTSNLSRFSLQHAGLLTGLDVRFTFETPMRENDLLTTQCGVGQVSGESDSSILGGPISLQKINYVAQITDTLSLSISPLGAKAHDMADTVNHLQGQALTAFAGSGPVLYEHCRGSAIGASVRSNNALLSVSQFLSGWGNRAADAISGPLCLSTLAQFMVQPSEHMVFSLSGVNNLWPSPPLPSSGGCHWSEMGPLVLCKSVTRPTQPTGTFTFNDLPSSSTSSFLSQGHIPERDSWNPDAESRAPLGSSGTAMQSVAVSGEVDLGGHVSVGGWAQLERADWLDELEKKDFQWNLSLAKSNGPNVNWGLSVGRRKREDWGEDGSASSASGPLEPTSSQVQMEAFVKFKVGRGFALQPGLVYILDKYTQTPAFMVRSSWTL